LVKTSDIVLAYIFEVLIFGEKMSPLTIVGAFAIMVGIILIGLAKMKPKSQRAERTGSVIVSSIDMDEVKVVRDNRMPGEGGEQKSKYSSLLATEEEGKEEMGGERPLNESLSGLSSATDEEDFETSQRAPSTSMILARKSSEIAMDDENRAGSSGLRSSWQSEMVPDLDEDGFGGHRERLDDAASVSGDAMESPNAGNELTE
jgi:hypothetical protein